VGLFKEDDFWGYLSDKEALHLCKFAEYGILLNMAM